jgi:cytochrome P450
VRANREQTLQSKGILRVTSDLAGRPYPSLEFLADPYPMHRYLRAEAPVYKVPDRNEYVISRHHDVQSVLADTETFSSTWHRQPEKPNRPYDMLETDPPDHKAKRALLYECLKPARLRQHLPAIEAAVSKLIDEFAGSSQVELVSQLAAPLPVYVFCTLFGMNPDELWSLHTASPYIGSARIYLSPEEQEPDLRRSIQMYEYLGDQLRLRHDEPRDDLLSHLIKRQQDRDGRADLEYLHAELDILFIGGLTTTPHLFINAMQILATQPSVMRTVRENDAAVSRLIEETVRFESPVQWVARLVTRDTTMEGVDIPAGARVVVALAAANRDEAVFDCPDEFRLERVDVRKHVGWGHQTHFCLGTQLARHEVGIAIRGMLDRFKDIQLSPGLNDFAPYPSPAFRSLTQLHLDLR